MGRYLSRKAAAEYLSVSTDTIDRARNDRRLPASRLGGRVVIDVKDLDALAASGSQSQDGAES